MHNNRSDELYYLSNRIIFGGFMFCTFHPDMTNQDFTPIDHCTRFGSHGQTYHLLNDNRDGFYWFYETDYFCFSIHDFHIKKDTVISCHLSDLADFTAFSFYVKFANAETLTPYSSLSNNTSLVIFNQKQEVRNLLHKNSNFYTIGVYFKEKMIEEYLLNQCHLDKEEIIHIFQESHKLISDKLEKLADDILNYKLTSVGSQLFYEVKAKEWLSVIINEYFNQEQSNTLNEADNIALSNVKHYINDHYASDIPQDLLAKIAMMSKTKLKNTFKVKYNMTLTEYTQRRRMTKAEQLLLTTHLEIKEVAMAVGYNSHSRFSNLFKKYMNLYPHDVRKQSAPIISKTCDNCLSQSCHFKKPSNILINHPSIEVKSKHKKTSSKIS